MPCEPAVTGNSAPIRRVPQDILKGIRALGRERENIRVLRGLKFPCSSATNRTRAVKREFRRQAAMTGGTG
jgi:hypothetical protein